VKAPARSATAATARRLLLLHPTARPVRRGTFDQERWNWSVRAAVVIVFGWGLLSPSYSLQGALVTAAYPAAVAIAYSLVLGYASVFDFAWNAVVGIGAYAFAFAEQHLGAGPLVGTVLAVVLASILGAVTTLPSAWLSGFQLALVTIAAATVFGAALVSFPSVSGGSSGLPVLTSWFNFSPLDTRAQLGVAIGVVVVTGLAVWATTAGRTGRLLIAAGDDEFLARSLGVRTTRVRVLAAMWAGALTGLVASFSVQQARVALPDSYGLPLLIQVFLVLVVGGRRSVWGPVAGSLIVVAIPAYIGGINGNVLTIVFGLLVVFTVVVRPAGLFQDRMRDRDGVLGALLGPLRMGRTRFRGTSKTSDLRLFTGVEAIGLVKSFGAVRALDHVSFKVGPHEVLGIVGPNGSGKTTLLNCLNGIWRLDEGSLRWRCRDGSKTAARASGTIALGRHGVGRSFQTPRVFGGLTLRDNLEVLPGGIRVPPDRMDAAVADWELGPWASQSVEFLPHGIRRAVEFARLDLSGASVLLLDEPAAGLSDEELARFVLAVRRWRDEGRCVVLVEHNHELVNAVCDRTMVLAAGKVLGVGDLEELRRGEHIREIIGDRLD
jgi:branched-chain amino acid transport system permease protein